MSLGEILACIDLADIKALVVPEGIQYHTAILLPYLVHDRTPGYSGSAGPHPCYRLRPDCLETLSDANCTTKDA